MNKNLPFVLSVTANVILFLFCLVGVIVWKKDPGSNEPVSEPTIVADVIDEPVAILPEEAVVPVPEEEPEITDSSPSPSSEIDFASLLVELEEMDFKIIPSRLLQKLDIRVLESDGSLSDEVLSVFSFGEEETERLNQLLVATGDRLRELEMQEVAFTQLSDDQFHIRIPPIAADVSEGLKEELRQGVKRELGDVDGSLLWDLMNGSHNSRFWSDFGETGGDYFLTIEGRDDENVLRFEKKHYKSEYHHFSTAMVGGPERLEWFIDNQLWRQTYLIDFLPEEAQRKIRTFTNVQIPVEP